MGIFDEIMAKEKDYIQIIEIVEKIAEIEGSIYKALMTLMHFRIDEKIPCYQKNDYFEFVDIDNDNVSTFSANELLWHLFQEYMKNGGINTEIKKLLDSEKEEFKEYFWLKSDLYDLELIKKLGVLEDFSDNQDLLETISFDDFVKESDENLKKIDVLYPTINYAEPHLRSLYLATLFSEIEAACLISGDDPIKMKALIDSGDLNYNWHYSVHAQVVKTIERAILSKGLQLEHNLITRQSLQQFLLSNGQTIQGFNTDIALGLLDQTRYGNLTIGHASPEHYQQKNKELSEKIEQLEKAYQELKSIQSINRSNLDIPDDLKGLELKNQLAKDRNGMARIIAKHLWSLPEHQQTLPKDMVKHVTGRMEHFCKEDEIPKDITSMKKIIALVVPEHLKNKKGRPPKKSIT
ncbi:MULTISPECIES: hypothetical protein [unclassified Acinetobacter]|uniref:hypothetical protein n=1 Tax=unclassified Acinetobacter TaxID=196816 RepID=UPI00244CB730|nr:MULTISPECIES: hypothetical protein [unclassified Acinetobacter]MDH0032088.1 hypothetical protein [Acinetobacter sp. GD04021]MDH0887744.1 hypothetical protein [Acinetobacter sp. GD03873]MDH1084092.1 hypothetical protein [Acinetobacter sp. GD03983]MDH2190981.1 hypothetical protein [Acinetobacter sp. GD03645]MDH2204604.1 hypothetical protein [Acinetobacter sp. GD03647]